MRALASSLGFSSLVLALAIALTMIGFAHRAAPTAMTPELEAYVAAGGVLSDICGTFDGEGVPVAFDCEACRITDNVIHSRMYGIAPAELTETLALAFVAKRIAERKELDPARLTRAPPQV